MLKNSIILFDISHFTIVIIFFFNHNDQKDSEITENTLNYISSFASPFLQAIFHINYLCFEVI